MLTESTKTVRPGQIRKIVASSRLIDSTPQRALILIEEFLIGDVKDERMGMPVLVPCGDTDSALRFVEPKVRVLRYSLV